MHVRSIPADRHDESSFAASSAASAAAAAAAGTGSITPPAAAAAIPAVTYNRSVAVTRSTYNVRQSVSQTDTHPNCAVVTSSLSLNVDRVTR